MPTIKTPLGVAIAGVIAALLVLFNSLGLHVPVLSDAAVNSFGAIIGIIVGLLTHAPGTVPAQKPPSQ